jgi:uncharacterized protein YdeI (YjbR/CyaY-like superfamily)
VEVDITPGTAPREITVPADLAGALAEDKRAQQTFDALPCSHRKEWVRWIEEAKKACTRSSRITKAVNALSEGK